MSTSGRNIDVLLYGATGFTGSLVAEYLTAKHHAPGLRITFAGRSGQKLSVLKANLLEGHGGAWPAAVPESIEANGEAEIDAIVRSAKVVISTAGPFLVASAPIVKACAAHGTDYVDITGETPFVRQTIDLHHEQAQASGALVVNMCGFDSIPSDLGCWRTVRAVRERFGEGTSSVECFASMRGSLSGGTLESGMEMERRPELKAMLRNPFLLGGEPPTGTRDCDADVTAAEPLGARFGTVPDAWTAPFMMASLNTRVVRRSNCLFSAVPPGVSAPGTPGEGYGAGFRYRERFLVSNEGEAQKLAKPIPPVAKREEMRAAGRLPKPGEGPSAKERAKSAFHFVFVGTAAESGKMLATSVSGGDPGYTETAKMVSEAALGLLLERSKMAVPSGVVTPSFAMANVLERRLEAAGIKFGDEGEDIQAALIASLGKKPRAKL